MNARPSHPSSVIESAPLGSAQRSNFTDPSEQPRVVEALRQYLALLETGRRPNRQEFLARHPDIADALADCLDGLEFVHSVAPQLSRPSDAGGSNASPAALVGGAPLGDFRLLREVGRGGMGIVYEAEQMSLGRRVALKVLPFAATMDAKQLQRFHNEAKAAACLHHEHIIPVYFVGCERGVHFYAMQFVEGFTLAQFIQSLRPPEARDAADANATQDYRPLPSPLAGEGQGGGDAPTPPIAALSTERSGPRGKTFYRQAAELIAQAANAVEYAHSLGIVHRDIKPANLILQPLAAAGERDGVEGCKLWVGDFGLAKMGPDAGLTMSGDLLGTLRYMAPEQALARHGLVDHRADVYALGATLYELLTLRPAVDASERAEILRQIAFEEPRALRKIEKAIPVELETITLKCLFKNPNERYPSARELADDLRRWLEDKAIRAKPPTWRQRAMKLARRHKPAVTLASILLFLLLGVLGASTFLIWREQRGTKAALVEANTSAERADVQRMRAEKHFASARDLVDYFLTEVGQKRLKDIPGTSGLRRELLEKALAFYQRFLEDEGTNPSVWYETGRAHLRVGEILTLLGQPGDAEAAYRQAIAVFDKLVADFPADADFRYKLARELAQTCYRWGLSLRFQRKYGEAEQVLRRGLDVLDRLMHQTPSDQDYRAAAGHVLGNLGDVLLFTGKYSEAKTVYLRALKIRTQLAEEFPDDPQHCLNLGDAHENVAGLWEKTGKLQEAMGAWRQATARQEKAGAAHPDIASCLRARLNSMTELARLLWETGQFGEAEKVLRNVASGWGKIEPDNSKLAQRHSFAYSRALLCRVQLDCGNVQDASTNYRALLTVSNGPFPSSYTINFWNENESARFLAQLADCAVVLGELPDAERLYRKALASFEDFAAPGFGLTEQTNVAACEMRLATVLWELGFHAQAEQRWHRAFAVLEKLIDTFPQVYSPRMNLAYQWANCPSTALRRPARALDLAKKTVDMAPEDGRCWRALGIAMFRAGDRNGAVDALEKAISLRAGGDARDRFLLACVQGSLGENVKARSWYNRASDWMEKHQPKNPELARLRAEAVELLDINDTPNPTSLGKDNARVAPSAGGRTLPDGTEPRP